MATESRRTHPSVAQHLFTEGYRFDFFQAVRLLERLYPQRQPIGMDASPAQEVVRFRAHPSLSFPASAIQTLAPVESAQEPAQMTITFMGLTGPLGVLPRHYSETVLERLRRKDHTLGDFLDVFNHRMVALFYRAWEKHHVPIAYERALVQGRKDTHFSQYLLDCIGLGTPGLRGRMEVEEPTLLFYAGLFAQQPRSASALRGLVQDYFGVAVEVVQFTGQWLPLEPQQRWRFGQSLGTAGRQSRHAGKMPEIPLPAAPSFALETQHRKAPTSTALGIDTVLGGRVWDQQARFTLRLGPLTYSEFLQFVPGGKAWRPLLQLSRFFVGQEHDFVVQPVLKAADIPPCQLGAKGPQAPRLGYSTWLPTPMRRHDAEDAVFTVRDC